MDDLEQEKGTGDTAGAASETDTKQATSQEQATVSAGTTEKTDAEKAEPASTPKTYTEEDVSAREQAKVKAEYQKWQSSKDKEVSSLQARIAELEQKQADKKDDANVALFDNILKKAEAGEFADAGDGEISDFKKALNIAKTIFQNVRQREKQVADREAKLGSVDKAQRTYSARDLTVKYGLPESAIETLAGIADETYREDKAKLMSHELKASPPKEEKQANTHKPDSSRATAPGGIDYDSLSAREKIDAGIEQAKKNRR